MLGIILMTAIPAYTRDIPFTQEDRDRIIRLEEGQKSINQRIDDLRADMSSLRADMNSLKADTNKRFDQMQTFMLWGFGILFGGMGLLITLVLWDRRTALAPAIRKNKELEERQELIEKALKEVAITNPDIKEALKHFGLL